MAVEINVTATVESLHLMRDQAAEAARPAAEAMATMAERLIKQELSTSSHPKGTPTPSRPGSPPSLITGSLRRSVRQTSSRSTGEGKWETRVAPGIVYARIQELGGRAGRGHASTLPARPYVRPAIDRNEDAIWNTGVRVIRRMLGI